MVIYAVLEEPSEQIYEWKGSCSQAQIMLLLFMGGLVAYYSKYTYLLNPPERPPSSAALYALFSTALLMVVQFQKRTLHSRISFLNRFSLPSCRIDIVAQLLSDLPRSLRC